MDRLNLSKLIYMIQFVNHIMANGDIKYEFGVIGASWIKVQWSDICGK